MVSPPDVPEHHHLLVNGVQIHVARLKGGTRPLLLLHGWPEFWLTWLPVMQRLAAQGYDVIAPDLRGFGDSDKPDAGPSDKAGADVHAEDMLALLDALRLPQVGLVATTSAQRRAADGAPGAGAVLRHLPVRLPLCRHGLALVGAGSVEGDLVLLLAPEAVCGRA